MENNTVKTKQELEQELAQMREMLAKRDAQLEDANASLEDAHSLLADANTTIGNMQTTIDGLHGETGENFSLNVKIADETEALEKLEELRDEIEKWLPRPGLSDLQRRHSLQGAGVRRYGFIDKISDIITVNPRFIPSNIDEEDYKELIREFEILRNMSIVTRQLLRMLLDAQLIVGDELFRLALSYYGAVRDAAKRRVPGAQELFNVLRQFFVSMRRTREEPTEHELLRDFKALEHGVKDGEIVIKNERPHLEGGKHVVVDETHKARAAWKESEKGEIEE